jgi:dephospho-CoA kinase
MVTFVISGKNATGKTEFCEYLNKKYNFEIIQIRETLEKITKYKDKDIAYKLYKIKKTGVLEAILPFILNKISNSKNIVIEGILSPEEVELLKKQKLDFYLVYLDANEAVRLERVIPRSKTVNPKRQIKNSDKFRVDIMNVTELKKISDLIIVNDGKTKPEFHSAINSGIKRMLIKKLTSVLNQNVKKNKIVSVKHYKSNIKA